MVSQISVNCVLKISVQKKAVLITLSFLMYQMFEANQMRSNNYLLEPRPDITSVNIPNSQIKIFKHPLNIIKKKNLLPDIFTTFPQLRQFQPILLMEKITNISIQNKFDPEKTPIHPARIGFLPKGDWPDKFYTLVELKQKFFAKRNGAVRQFAYKLYNALKITQEYPDAYKYVGAIWITDDIMKIEANIFSHLLGISCVQGGLFHKQGNFTRHGFENVLKNSSLSLMRNPDCADVDDYNVRLFRENPQNEKRNESFHFVRESNNSNRISSDNQIQLYPNQ